MEAVLGRLTAMVSDIGGCKDTIYIYIVIGEIKRSKVNQINQI